MNMKFQRDRLVDLIVKFLKGKVSHDTLSTFSWDIIEYFTETPENKLPPKNPGEEVFWYAIWQIQHLSDEEHTSVGSCRSQMENILDYLRMEKPLPSDYWGKRP